MVDEYKMDIYVQFYILYMYILKNFNSLKDKSLISEILYLATLHRAIFFKKSSET